MCAKSDWNLILMYMKLDLNYSVKIDLCDLCIWLLIILLFLVSNNIFVNILFILICNVNNVSFKNLLRKIVFESILMCVCHIMLIKLF